MLFLSTQEVAEWKKLAAGVVAGQSSVAACRRRVRGNLASAFHFYCGNLLFAAGQAEKGLKVFSDGALIEDDGLFSNAFIASFLQRHGMKMEMPALCFEDPQPFIHFTTTPELKKAREIFVKFFAHTLPPFSGPFRLMDIGPGNGALTAAIITELKDSGKITEVGEIMLVDSSPAMLAMAAKTVAEVVPPEKIKTLSGRIQDLTGRIERRYDVAFSSLAYHHMPYEVKEARLRELKAFFDHFIIFEIHSDNDTPELHSPELALAVYQSYGRVIDFIYAHDTDLKTAQTAVDNFLMTEEISFLTQPRGERTDYHMLREQWLRLFDSVLAPEFKCLGNTDCYADEFITLIAMHYGRE